jgi:hypothetical protein
MAASAARLASELVSFLQPAVTQPARKTTRVVQHTEKHNRADTVVLR